jgi:hypothetical protein
MSQRPRMFVGSSSETLQIAWDLQEELAHDVEAKVWSQGVFGVGSGTLESLVEEARRVQFAALVLGPDDRVIKRDVEGDAPRDNVLFEAGFFIGSLGRKNTFLVSREGDHLELANDLNGVTRAEYKRNGDLRAAIGPAANKIRRAVRASLDSGPAPVPRAAFAKPTDGLSVEHRVPVGGRADVPAGAALWAVVTTTSPGSNYHPQGSGLQALAGRFSGDVFVGDAGSTGSYRLLLVLVDTVDSQYFHQYQQSPDRKQNHPGISKLPPSAKLLDEIQVTRS